MENDDMNWRLTTLLTIAAIGFGILATTMVEVGASLTRLDDADTHLREAIALINAAEAPRVNRAAFDRYRQNALAACQQAREQIRLAQQAPSIPPGYLPQR